jgi:hypothetical protein
VSWKSLTKSCFGRRLDGLSEREAGLNVAYLDVGSALDVYF